MLFITKFCCRRFRCCAQARCSSPWLTSTRLRCTFYHYFDNSLLLPLLRAGKVFISMADKYKAALHS
jgi:hypothetical protein